MHEFKKDSLKIVKAFSGHRTFNAGEKFKFEEYITVNFFHFFPEKTYKKQKSYFDKLYKSSPNHKYSYV